MMLSILERSAAMAREVCMEFTCHTTYDQKALTAMARVVRKTVRAKRSRMIRVWAWVIIGLLAVSLWLSWGNIWQTAANCAVIAALLLINWKEDALNAFLQSVRPCRARTAPIPHSSPTAFSSRLLRRNPSGSMIKFLRWRRPWNTLFW